MSPAATASLRVPRRPLAFVGASSIVLTAALTSASCVNPQDDFTDYVSRAADAQGLVQPGSGDAGADTGPLYAPDASIATSTYFMSCLSQLAEVPAQASNFAATLGYTPVSGGGGTLTVSLQALVSPGATNLGDTSGATVSAKPTPVAANGTAHVDFGAVTVPGNANAVQPGAPIVFSDVTMDFHIESAQAVCSLLGGTLTMPVGLTLTPSRNPCILVPVASATAPIPTVQASQYHCP
jgi:hypothetical protein